MDYIPRRCDIATRRYIPSTDPRLNRHVWHDPHSRAYTPDLTGLALKAFAWQGPVNALDQGQVGACTSGASATCLLTGPFRVPAVSDPYGARWGSLGTTPAMYAMYSAEETYDGDGPYPPNDSGSTGLTAGHVLRDAGVISGWTQTFTLEDALTAGTQQPWITGTDWLNSQFQVDPRTGLVTVDRKSGLAGGHEYTGVGYDPVRGWVWYRQDWGDAYGVDGSLVPVPDGQEPLIGNGYFAMQAEDYGWLLGQQGDTTFFTLPTAPAPQPTPVPVDSAAQALADTLVHDGWYRQHHIGGNGRVARAAGPWLQEIGRT